MWIKQRTTQRSLDVLGQLSDLCAAKGGYITREIKTLLDKGDYLSVAGFKFHYRESDDVEDILYARQIQAFFSKNAMDLPAVGSSATRAQAALDSFLRSELLCAETNQRLLCMSPEKDVNSVIHGAMRKISNILGVVPSLESLEFAFGPGANTNVKGTSSNAREKLSVRAACSYHLAPHLGAFLAEVPEWTRSLSSYEDDERFLVQAEIHNARMQCVPKNFKTDRTILIEPLMNSFFQKGFGSYIRDRLNSVGVNLRDQSFNQRLAAIGSVDGSFATIDLSMASDTLSVGLVSALLPPAWVDLLYSLTTRQVELPDGSVCYLNKFSSMGNGFTFELESLIFYALASASMDLVDGDFNRVCNVYGDDIIIPTPVTDLLERSLAYAGFTVNREKSFSVGPFRESCGADYYKGIDVRPLYVKTALSDRNLYAMHNWFLRHGEPDLAQVCLSYTDVSERLFGPDGFGDGHLIGSHSLRYPRGLRRNQYSGGYFDTYSLKPLRSLGLRRGDAVLPVYSVYIRSGADADTDPYIVRGSKGYVKQSIYTLSTTVFNKH